MAITGTSLSAACTMNDTRLYVTSTTGAVVGQPMLVESEYIARIVVIGTNYVDVGLRGAEGTAARAHNVGSPVEFCLLGSEFPVVPAGSVVQQQDFVTPVVSYSTSGAMAVPTRDTFALLTSTGVGVYSLGAPSQASDGTLLTITSQTTGAHTLNAASTANLIASSTDAALKQAATFAAYGTLSLRATNGLWNVVGNSIATFS